MKIETYIKRSHKRGLESDELIGDFLDWVDSLVLQGLLTPLKSSKNLTTGQIDRLFRASEWDKYSKQLQRGRNSVLNKVIELHKEDIADLKLVYGNVEFNSSDVIQNLAPVGKFLTAEIEKVLNLKDSLQYEVEGLRSAFIASQYSDQIPRIESYLGSVLKPNKNVRTEFITASSNMYQAIRVEFFKKVEVEGEKLFEYMGVRDQSNRRFCSKWLGKQRSEAFWKALSNGMNGVAWYQIGGYYCRHMIMLVIK